MKTRGFLIGALAAAAAALGGGAEEAMATTYCVPNLAACPGVGGAVAEGDLEKAMGLNATDGVPDTIIIAAGTISENANYEPGGGYENPGTFEPTGSDPVTVRGAGRGATIVTSAGTGNIFLLNLASNNSRDFTIRDLTLKIPASFTDDGGAAAALGGDDVLERVDIVSANPGSDGIPAAVGTGNVFRGGELRGEGAGTIFEGLVSGTGNGSLLVEDATLKNTSWALGATGTGSHLTARRVTEIGTQVLGVFADPGTVTIENSVLRIDDGIGLFSWPGADDATIDADHVTIVNSGGTTSPGIEVKKTSGAGDATVNLTNSILRGFGSGYAVSGVAGPGIGIAALHARYSNFQKTGSSNAVLDIGTGNIDADPKFNADLSLPPSSPSVDAGDPAAGLTTDFLGALRPTDGNGDGTARRDQGAFEYQPPTPPGNGGGGGGPAPAAPAPADTLAPQAKLLAGPGKALAEGKAKFRFNSSEKGATFTCKLDGRKPSPCKSPKSYSGLKPGRHTFKVWATDPTGNKSPRPAKRRFRIPAPAV